MALYILISAGDAKESYQNIPCCFTSRTPSGQYFISTCILDMTLLHSVKHESVYHCISNAFDNLGLKLSSIRC